MNQLALFEACGGRSKIYFLLCGDAVKVGLTSRTVRTRREEGQTWREEPITVLGWIWGGRREERAHHLALAAYRIRSDGRGREWFRADAFVLDYIRRQVDPNAHLRRRIEAARRSIDATVARAVARGAL